VSGGNLKYAPPPLGQAQAEDATFEFKPLDLSGLKRTDTRVRRMKKVIVPCGMCGQPGCKYEKEVMVDDDE
jgi:hypothetical protein